MTSAQQERVARGVCCLPVSPTAFNYDNPSSIPADVNTFFVTKTEKSETMLDLASTKRDESEC